MGPMRVYLDTSVFGGCFDPPFRDDSVRVLDAVRTGRLIAIVSDVLADELAPAPARVREILLTLPAESLEAVSLTAEVQRLRDAYLAAGILGPKSRNDAVHVAMATVARADAIVSWNFGHIVRLDKIKGFNSVNFRQGYGILTIISPKECRIDEQADE